MSREDDQRNAELAEITAELRRLRETIEKIGTIVERVFAPTYLVEAPDDTL